MGRWQDCPEWNAYGEPLDRHALLAILITVAYGASDEYHQRFVAGRSSELADLYADAAGASVAAALSWACGIIAVRSDV